MFWETANQERKKFLKAQFALYASIFKNKLYQIQSANSWLKNTILSLQLAVNVYF